jgi:polysaccharide biosynthesis protein PslJ
VTLLDGVRPPLPRVDTTTLLTAYLALLLLLPSTLVVGALGAAGSLATILSAGFGLLMLTWCLVRRARPAPWARPVAIAAGVFGAAILVSYAAAASRPINAAELRSADRGLITLAGWMGVLFVALYGRMTRERLDRLLIRLVAFVGAGAVLGILQFYSGHTFVDQISIPGLSPNQPAGTSFERGGFVRPAGMASHPIEFAVVMTMTLPIALHYAMTARRHTASVVRRWWPVAAIALAIPQSLSRSAILCFLAGMLVVAVGWTWRQRRAAVGCVLVVMMGVYLAIPGMLGTLIGLFTGISDDGSAASRTDSYGLAWVFIEASPVFGRGFATFLPSYRILDNQYLGLLIETGAVGLGATLALLVTTITVGFTVVRRTDDLVDRSLARALSATVVVAAVGFATFDALGFPQVPGLLFLVLGLVGALGGSLGPEVPAADGEGAETAVEAEVPLARHGS